MQVIPNLEQQIFSLSPDCHISNLSNNNDDIKIATSLDYFTPIVDDPYLQGQITVCNVLSDIYAIGCTEIDHFLGILSISTNINKQQRIEISTQIIKGMVNKLQEANTKLVGGQTTLNPWFLTGGCVVAKLNKQQHIIQNNKAQIGDKIILTKALGTRITVNMYQKIRKNEEYKNKVDKILGLKQFDKIYNTSIDSMNTLNLYSAQCMQKYYQYIKCCTDITGFGLKGHCQNLNNIQEQDVNFYIDKIPIFGNLEQYYNKLYNFNIYNCELAETSGGLLIVIDKNKVEEFQQKLEIEYNQQSWIIGEVIKDNNEKNKKQTIISDKLEFINI